MRHLNMNQKTTRGMQRKKKTKRTKMKIRRPTLKAPMHPKETWRKAKSQIKKQKTLRKILMPHRKKAGTPNTTTRRVTISGAKKAPIGSFTTRRTKTLSSRAQTKCSSL